MTHTRRDLEPQVRCVTLCINRRCAACSELRIVHVRVLCGVRAIVRNVVQVEVRSLSQPYVREYEVQGTFPLHFQKRDVFPKGGCVSKRGMCFEKGDVFPKGMCFQKGCVFKRVLRVLRVLGGSGL